jgi:hypothetical protein
VRVDIGQPAPNGKPVAPGSENQLRTGTGIFQSGNSLTPFHIDCIDDDDVWKQAFGMTDQTLVPLDTANDFNFRVSAQKVNNDAR